MTTEMTDAEMTTEIPDPTRGHGKYLPFFMGYLTDELIERSKLELNETEELKTKCIKELIELLDDHSNLNYRRDESFLLQFLRVRKFNVEEAYKTILNYYDFQRSYSDLIENVDEERIIQIFENDYYGFLPYRDENASVICFLKGGLWDPETLRPDEIIIAGCVAAAFAIKDPATQVAGFRGIFDAKGVGMKHLAFCTPFYIKLGLKASMKCFPGRYRGLHVVNESRIVDIGWKIIKPFLPSHIRKLVVFHGHDLDSLHEYFPPCILPKEFGGLLEPLSNTVFIKEGLKERDYLYDQRRYGYTS